MLKPKILPVVVFVTCLVTCICILCTNNNTSGNLQQISSDEKLPSKKPRNAKIKTPSELDFSNPKRIAESFRSLENFRPEDVPYILDQLADKKNNTDELSVYIFQTPLILKLVDQNVSACIDFLGREGTYNKSTVLDLIQDKIAHIVATKNPELFVEKFVKQNPKSAKFTNSIMIAMQNCILINRELYVQQAIDYYNGDSIKQSGVLLKLASSDPKYCLEFLNKNKLAPTSALDSQLFRQLLNKEPNMFFSSLNDLDSGRLLRLYSNIDIMDAALNVNALECVKIASNLPITASSQSILGNFAARLIQNNDFELWKSFVGSFENTKTAEIITQSSFISIASNDMAKAREYMDALPHELKGVAVKSVAKVMVGRSSLADSLRYLQSFPSDIQAGAVSEVYQSTLAYKKQDELIQVIQDPQFANINHLINAESRGDIVSNAISQIARADLNKGIELAMNMSSYDKSDAFSGLMNLWLKRDPIAASEWLSKQPAGPARDAGAQEIINQIKDTDPETAEQWRKSMTPK
jgi:hypothetical protein